MFKKIFKSLTQSKEAQFLEELESKAAAIAESGARQSASILHSLGRLKHSIDQKLNSRDRSMLQIEDFDSLAQSICEGLHAKIKELAALEIKMPHAVTSGDGRQLESHLNEWRTCLATVMKGYSLLHYAATGEKPTDIDTLDAQSLNPALESLELQIRTAERIRNELG